LRFDIGRSIEYGGAENVGTVSTVTPPPDPDAHTRLEVPCRVRASISYSALTVLGAEDL